MSSLKPLRRWGDISEPTRWIRAVALRFYRRYEMANRQRTLVEEMKAEGLHPPALDSVDQVVPTLEVMAALGTLNPDARAVVAFIMDGFSISTIAEELHMSSRQVEGMLRKARRLLARSLSAVEDKKEK